MQPKNRIFYSPIATDDLDEIFSYITKDNNQSAEKLLKNIDDSIAKLADFHNLGSSLSDDDFALVSSGYRFIVVHPYLIFYRIIGQSIIISRILHSRRDYLRSIFNIQE